MRAKYVMFAVVVGVLLSSAAMVLAGNLDPPSAPADAASQMWTLEQIYQRLNSGTAGTKMASFTEPLAGPGTGTMHTLDDIMAMAPAPDNSDGAAPGDVLKGRTYWGLRTDGSWGPQIGTSAGNPDPPCFDNQNRYVDCGNGTVHDTVTGLTWLKKADCFGFLDYAAANNAAAGLEHGECELTDNSSPGDWRLPTSKEWDATVAQAKLKTCENPCLTNTPGTACYSAPPQPFAGVESDVYWSSTASQGDPTLALGMSLVDGTGLGGPKTDKRIVWPVRGGH